VYAGGAHSCVLFNDGSVKCWGDNSKGQLGIRISTGTIGLGSDMGDNLPFVTLGTNGETAKFLTLGFQHTCAVLNNDTLKCWGSNNKGQLGIDNTSNVGTLSTGTLALQNLNSINLETTVKQLPNGTPVSAGYESTCAILANDSVKCWGANSGGGLTYGGILGTNSAAASLIGNASGSMATAGTAIIGNLIPAYVGVGYNHACIVGTSGGQNAMKCWGGDSRNNGVNGAWNNTNKGMGDAATEMESVGNFIFGSGTLISSMTTSYSHNCSILSDSSIRCWGDNASGQLGIGSIINTNAGNSNHAIITSGDLSPVSNVTVGTSVLELFAGQNHNCATVNTVPVKVKCWGGNSNGQLGIDSTQNIGISGFTVSASTFAQIPTSVNIVMVAAGYNHNCALLQDNTITCWGLNTSGQLGRGDNKVNIGTTANPMSLLTAPVKLTGQ
jgi:alpha-tubulin suppressor-like RCC1 family protein